MLPQRDHDCEGSENGDSVFLVLSPECLVHNYNTFLGKAFFCMAGKGSCS
jgi:hypothetical protein